MANMYSGGAMWTFIVASAWMVLDRSDSSGWVGIITFASMLPFLIVSPIGGLMADRFDRRKGHVEWDLELDPNKGSTVTRSYRIVGPPELINATAVTAQQSAAAPVRR